MAQRKPTSGPAKRPATTPVPGARTGPGARPPVRKPNKSIVNQKQTPWGLVGVVAAIVAFAVAIVVVVVVTHKDTKSTSLQGPNVPKCSKSTGSSKTAFLNANVCAKSIAGVEFYPISDRNHVTTTVNYPQTPPVGGNHSPYWADCSGTVYAEPIANENAVHMLEHGAIWITYNEKTISPSDLNVLEKLVQGVNYMALSPYPDLKTPVSVQSWGYQLFLPKATDPRLKSFISDLRLNPQTTPEYGATCSQPTFIASPSTFGQPLFAPAT